MATEQLKVKCACGGGLAVLDQSECSATAMCQRCNRASLIIHPPRTKAYVQLCDFHLKRGDHGRPLGDLNMATRLFEDLILDRWPSPAVIVDFGIDSSSHLGALQFAVRAGVTPYDLDRVMGDGPAITQLVRTAPVQPYGFVDFHTVWDGAFKLTYTG